MLTDVAIRRLKPRDKPFKVGDMHGLYLLVKPDGARYWRMDFRHAGKRGTVALGIYPHVSLKEAREERASARKLLDKGVNPSAYKKLTRGVSAIGAGNSFNVVADEWLGKLEAEGRSPATLEKLRWLLGFARPLLGERPIGEITAPELLTVLRTVEVRGRYESARRRRSTCGSIIRYAIATGRAQRDVSVDLHGALISPKVKHYAAIIEPAKVGALLRAIDGYEGQPTRPTMRFVGVKSPEKQRVLELHRTRLMLTRQRTQIGNAIRAHLAGAAHAGDDGAGQQDGADRLGRADEE